MQVSGVDEPDERADDQAMTSTASLTPQQIDTELARIWLAEQQAQARAAQARDFGRRYPHHKADSDERADRYDAEADACRAEAEPFELEYRLRGGWSRYFLVTNSNGHVHREMTCSTCYATTVYAWLPELSDCDEAEMITEFGEKACTVCFPDAPANPAFHAPGRRDAEAIAARAAEKAEKAAAKAAKALPEPVAGPYGKIVTKVAARNELSGAVQSFGFYGPSHPTDFVGFASPSDRGARGCRDRHGTGHRAGSEEGAPRGRPARHPDGAGMTDLTVVLSPVRPDDRCMDFTFTAKPVRALDPGDWMLDLRTDEVRKVAELVVLRTGLRVHFVDGGSRWFAGTEHRMVAR